MSSAVREMARNKFTDQKIWRVIKMSSIRNLYINSAEGFRDIGGTDENFTITKTISNFSQVPIRVRLESARIPFTWNNITDANNSFELIETPGPITHTILVPVGYYTGATLAVALATAINSTPGILYAYTVTYDSTSLHFTITATGNFQLNFSGSNSIAAALGFNAGTTISATSATSPNVALLLADTEIFISSTLVGGIDNGVVPWFTGTSTDLHILAVVPITACFGGIIQYQANPLEPWQSAIQSSFSSIISGQMPSPVEMGFSLFFLSGLPVQLNGAHWSANLLLDFTN